MGKDFVLAEPLTDQPEGIGRRPDGDVVPLQEVGKCPDVVFVSVGDDDPYDAPSQGVEGRKIRVNDVHAEPAVIERDPAVDENDLAALLYRHAVHAYLA